MGKSQQKAWEQSQANSPILLLVWLPPNSPALPGVRTMHLGAEGKKYHLLHFKARVKLARVSRKVNMINETDDRPYDSELPQKLPQGPPMVDRLLR